jgi:hypothetical protein
MPSDFIPAISPERREYIAAAGGLAIKHATVSPLLCEAVRRAHIASQGFPTIRVLLEFLSSGLEETGSRTSRFPLNVTATKIEFAGLVLGPGEDEDQSGHVGRSIPNEVRGDPGE